MPLAVLPLSTAYRAMDLSLPHTVILLATSAVLTVFFGWMGSRPADPHKGPRMVPWRFLMLLGFTVALLMIVHALNLVGFTTGQSQSRY